MKLLPIILPIILLSGCTLAPGIHLSSQARSQQSTVADIDYRVISVREAVGTSSSDKWLDTSVLDGLLSKADYQYRVQAGDVLLITVYDHPELTMPGGPNTHPATSGTVIKADGSIFFPYVGRVKASGKTTEQIRQEITAKLADYITNPQLDVRVVDYRSQKVQVGGSVLKPAVIPLTSTPLTLMEAIQLAGGFTDVSDERMIRLHRDGQSYLLDLYQLMQSGFPLHRLVLKDKDSIYVEANTQNKVYVMGEVVSPKPVAISKYGLSLIDAIGEVGGLNNLTANAEGIYVIRQSKKQKEFIIYQLDGSEEFAFVLADEFMLQPKDVVYVSAAGVTRWNRVLSQLLPTSVLLRNAAETRN